MGKPARARWSRLPAPLAERILGQAFQSSDKSVLQWLHLSLVCRDWQRMMSQKPAHLALTRLDPKRSLTAPQLIAWLLATRVPLRSISIDTSLFLAHHIDADQTTFTELAISSDMLTTSTPHLQAHELMKSLPTSLESLRLDGMAFVEGRSFACLPRLRQLRIKVGLGLSHPKSVPDDNVIHRVELAGLPAGLESLEVLADQAWLRVTLAPGPPAALLRLEANGIELQEEAGPEGTGTGRCNVGLLEMITGALTLNTHNIAIIEEGTDWYSIEVLQEAVAERLAEWIACSDIAAVQLDVRVDYAPTNQGHFNLDVQHSAEMGMPYDADYDVRPGSTELLDAVSSCQQPGIRCSSVVKPTGQLILYERV